MAQVADSCAVCRQRPGKYTCPRCQGATCSLTCYKGHGDSCVQDFYKDQVFEVLRNRKASDKSQQEMQEILGRLFPQDETLPEYQQVSEERLEYLLENSEKPDILEELSPVELQAFAYFLKSGKCREDLECYTPWWEEDPSPNYEVLDLSSPQAAAFEALPSLQTLTSIPPSAVLPYHILNALWAIAYTWRLFNGDTETCRELMLGHVMEISEALGGRADASMGTAALAIGRAEERALRLDQSTCKPLLPVIHSDLSTIARSKSLTLESFFQLHSLAQPSSSLQAKVHYYLAYLKPQSTSFFHSLTSETQDYLS